MALPTNLKFIPNIVPGGFMTDAPYTTQFKDIADAINTIGDTVNNLIIQINAAASNFSIMLLTGARLFAVTPTGNPYCTILPTNLILTQSGQLVFVFQASSRVTSSGAGPRTTLTYACKSKPPYTTWTSLDGTSVDPTLVQSYTATSVLNDNPGATVVEFNSAEGGNLLVFFTMNEWKPSDSLTVNTYWRTIFYTYDAASEGWTLNRTELLTDKLEQNDLATPAVITVQGAYADAIVYEGILYAITVQTLSTTYNTAYTLYKTYVYAKAEGTVNSWGTGVTNPSYAADPLPAPANTYTTFTGDGHIFRAPMYTTTAGNTIQGVYGARFLALNSMLVLVVVCPLNNTISPSQYNIGIARMSGTGVFVNSAGTPGQFDWALTEADTTVSIYNPGVPVPPYARWDCTPIPGTDRISFVYQRNGDTGRPYYFEWSPTAGFTSVANHVRLSTIGLFNTASAGALTPFIICNNNNLIVFNTATQQYRSVGINDALTLSAWSGVSGAVTGSGIFNSASTTPYSAFVRKDLNGLAPGGVIPSSILVFEDVYTARGTALVHGRNDNLSTSALGIATLSSKVIPVSILPGP